MKKIEAEEIAILRSRLIIEYLEQMLSDTEKISGKMYFASTKIGNQDMCTLDILVSQKNWERHLNLGITSDYCDVLYEQLFSDLLDTFLEHETIGVTGYYTIKYMIGQNFSGINAVNSNGSLIKLNFGCQGNQFQEIVAMYDQRISDYAEKVNSGRGLKK